MACFVYGSLRPDDDSGMPWTKAACAFMSWRRAIVKDAQLFNYHYASAILERPGHHVVGCILTCEMSDETVIGNSSWGKIKETAVDFEKNEAIQT